MYEADPNVTIAIKMFINVQKQLPKYMTKNPPDFILKQKVIIKRDMTVVTKLDFQNDS